jgi:GNAT superfamily N-acetyltransferase
MPAQAAAVCLPSSSMLIESICRWSSVRKEVPDMHIRPAKPQDTPNLTQLIAEFRLSLAELRGKTSELDPDAAHEELVEYHLKGFPIYVAEVESGELLGYLVCRVDGEVVWAESLYVRETYRCLGVGSALYAQAEQLAQSLGGGNPYNWVDPDNDKIIRFLSKRGYNVLNLIELRRRHPGEEPSKKVRVGDHEFER